MRAGFHAGLGLRQPSEVHHAVDLRRPAISRTLGIVRRSGRSLSPAAAFAEVLARAGRTKAKPMRKS